MRYDNHYKSPNNLTSGGGGVYIFKNCAEIF